MLVQQIITDVRNELVEASASFWSDTELLALANRAERDFVNKTRCLESKGTLSLVAGQQDYQMPANFLSMIDVFYSDPNSTTGINVWRRLPIFNVDKASQLNPNFMSADTSLQGTPNRGIIWNRSLFLDPIPNALGATQLLMFYKAKQVPMVIGDQINIDDALSEAINNFILWKAWKKEQEDDKAAEYQAGYIQNVKEGLRWVKLQALAERKRLDIESPKDFGGGNAGFNPFRS